MACGILIVDKPQGWTSQDVVAKLRGVFHEKRVGHGGTLDPMATGVLPVFVGRATRAVPFFESAEKGYLAHLRLGISTNTQDIQGEVLAETPQNVSREDLQAVLPRFLGDISQIPPMFSAIKIGGKKLYELARQGKEVERKGRLIHIFSLAAGEKTEEGDFPLTVHCSKGTYVRTLCHDLGETLGCGGCMSYLRRLKAGRFTLSDAHTLEEILQAEDPTKFLLPVDSLFGDLPAVTLTEKEEVSCRHGNPIVPFSREGKYFRVYNKAGEFLMLGRRDGHRLMTEKSFFEVK